MWLAATSRGGHGVPATLRHRPTEEPLDRCDQWPCTDASPGVHSVVEVGDGPPRGGSRAGSGSQHLNNRRPSGPTSGDAGPPPAPGTPRARPPGWPRGSSPTTDSGREQGPSTNGRPPTTDATDRQPMGSQPTARCRQETLTRRDPSRRPGSGPGHGGRTGRPPHQTGGRGQGRARAGTRSDDDADGTGSSGGPDGAEASGTTLRVAGRPTTVTPEALSRDSRVTRPDPA